MTGLHFEPLEPKLWEVVKPGECILCVENHAWKEPVEGAKCMHAPNLPQSSTMPSLAQLPADCRTLHSSGLACCPRALWGDSSCVVACTRGSHGCLQRSLVEARTTELVLGRRRQAGNCCKSNMYVLLPCPQLPSVDSSLVLMRSHGSMIELVGKGRQ